MAQTRDQRASTGAARRRRIACLSTAPWNPYLRLLYGHLAALGFELVEGLHFSLRSLWRERSKVRFIHVHWPEGLYRFERGPTSLRRPLSWVKLVLFAIRLVTARRLGYRLVWTIHQVYPHESADGALDRRAARLLGRACHLLVAHDHWTAAYAASELGTRAVAVVPHGSYIGAYPDGRSRQETRDALGLPHDSLVFLAFGELRAYKEIDLLLSAFESAVLPHARLVVAGNPKIPTIGSTVRAASARDPRILGILEFVPDERVAELFHACDVAVSARGDPGTSGSLILALSMGLPIVAADLPTTRELVQDAEAGWLFRARDSTSLGAALERAGADPSEARERGARAFRIAERLDWNRSVQELARLLDGVDG